MTSMHIKISGTGSRHNTQAREVIDDIQRVMDKVKRLKAVYDQAAMDQDWAGLGVVLDMEPGDAEDYYNLFGSVAAEFAALVFTPQLLSRGG